MTLKSKTMDSGVAAPDWELTRRRKSHAHTQTQQSAQSSVGPIDVTVTVDVRTRFNSSNTAYNVLHQVERTSDPIDDVGVNVARRLSERLNVARTKSVKRSTQSSVSDQMHVVTLASNPSHKSFDIIEVDETEEGEPIEEDKGSKGSGS